MELINQEDAAPSRGRYVRWGFRLLVGGVIVAMGADAWDALRTGIEHVISWWRPLTLLATTGRVWTPPAARHMMWVVIKDPGITPAKSDDPR